MDNGCKKLKAAMFATAIVISALGGVTAQSHKKDRFKERAALIKGGVFQMGIAESEIPGLQKMFNIKRAELFREASPKHSVLLSDFYFDKTEVTNAAYKTFLDRNPEWRKEKIGSEYHNGKYLQNWSSGTFPTGEAKSPVVFVSWHSAVAYCRSVGMRLPTEAEWEYAARGGMAGKLFPWGDSMPDRIRLNFGGSGLEKAIAVASYKPNGYGLFDMAGNVWEYLADEWQAYPANASIQSNPVAGGDLFGSGESYRNVKTRRVIRGGSYGAGPVNLLVTYRDSHLPNNTGDHVGFRCAISIKEK